MATAGRILIIPRGKWDATTTYENLDLVAHKNGAWLAKKPSVGIEPSEANAEYWHDFLGGLLTPENIGALSIEGGLLKGDLYIQNVDNGHAMIMKNHTTSADYGTYYMDQNAEGKKVGFVVSANRNTAEFKDAEGKEHKVFGEHNKPIGNYVGNGSATERKINIGGTGIILAIYGCGALTFVINGAAWSIRGNSMVEMIEGISFYNGELTVATNNIYVNDNNTTFTYYVL